MPIPDKIQANITECEFGGVTENNLIPMQLQSCVTVLTAYPVCTLQKGDARSPN
jgi:hypothetical protein